MTFRETVTGAWGILPLAVPAALFVAMRLGSLVFPENAAHRALGGLILTMALIVAGTSTLAALHLLTFGALALCLVALVAVTAGLALAQRGKPLASSWRSFPWAAMVSYGTLPLVLVVGFAVGVAVVAARWLPIWQWDSLGYHLPYVNFILVGHALDSVPSGLPYLSTYPHNVDLYVVALRAMLPDDRLIDLSQIPLGILGAAATAGIARLFGAERAHAVAAGCAWLVMPAVFLELPTNYVDVGSAAFLLTAIYFLLVPPSPRTLLVAGVALGLYLGSKANAPLGTAILGTLLLVRGLRAKLPGATGAALVIAFALGAGSFLGNLFEYGNPIWPVEVQLGPWRLPGTLKMSEVLGGGSVVVRAHGALPWRMLASWTDFTNPPVHDMRVGGYGPLFLLALPFAVTTLVRAARSKNVALCIAFVATLASPDPEVARYVLAFPALVFALAVPHLVRWPSRPRVLAPALSAAAAALAIWQIVYAWPGLTGEGPPLSAFATMSDDERARTFVGADGPPAPYMEARQRVKEGETYAFDRGDDLLYYLAWESDLRYRVVAMPEGLSEGRIPEFLERENVRVFMTRRDTPVGIWAEAHPEAVTLLFSRTVISCSVYERR